MVELLEQIFAAGRLDGVAEMHVQVRLRFAIPQLQEMRTFAAGADVWQRLSFNVAEQRTLDLGRTSIHRFEHECPSKKRHGVRPLQRRQGVCPHLAPIQFIGDIEPSSLRPENSQGDTARGSAFRVGMSSDDVVVSAQPLGGEQRSRSVRTNFDEGSRRLCGRCSDGSNKQRHCQNAVLRSHCLTSAEDR